MWYQKWLMVCTCTNDARSWKRKYWRYMFTQTQSFLSSFHVHFITCMLCIKHKWLLLLEIIIKKPAAAHTHNFKFNFNQQLSVTKRYVTKNDNIIMQWSMLGVKLFTQQNNVTYIEHTNPILPWSICCR